MNSLIDTRTKTYKNGKFVPRNNNKRTRTVERKQKRKKNLLKTNQQQHNNANNTTTHSPNKRHKSRHNGTTQQPNNKANKKFMELLEQDNLIGNKNGLSKDEQDILALEAKLGIKSADNTDTTKQHTKKQRLAKELIDDGLGELLELCDEYEEKGLLKPTAFSLKQNKTTATDDHDDVSVSDDSDAISIDSDEEQVDELDDDDTDASDADDNDEIDSGSNDDSADDIDVEERALLKRLAEIRQAKQHKAVKSQATTDDDSVSDDGDNNDSDDSVDQFDDAEADSDSDNNEYGIDDAEDESDDDNTNAKHVKPTYDELYGFNAPTSQSLLEFKGLADNNTSNTVTNGKPNKYVPPHLRNKSGNTSDIVTQTVQGLLNKLGESNIESILLDIQKLYNQHSRHNVNTVLCATILHNLNNSTQLLQQLAILYAAVITTLHMIQGIATGSLFIETIVLKLVALLQQQPHDTHDAISDKTIPNILLLISYMYNFHLLNAELISDIITHLLNSNDSTELSEHSIEHILIILQHCGYQIRRNNAIQLKHIIVTIQGKLSKNTNNTNSRTKYMIELINNIKNNKKASTAHTDTIEHIQSQMNTVAKKHKTANLTDYRVDITLNDYMNIKSVGRWWLTGASYKQNTDNKLNDNTNNTDTVIDHKIATKLQLTSSNKRLLFTILTESSDLNDCYNKLIVLKNNQSDIVTLIFTCFHYEAVYNKYYELLLCKLMNYNTEYLKLVYNYIVEYMNKLSSINNVSQVTNIAVLCTNLLTETKLQLSFLSHIDWIQLHNSTVLFVHQLLINLCQQCDKKQLKYMFNLFNLKHEYDGVKLGLIKFIKQFCLKDADDSTTTLLKYIEHTLRQETVEHKSRQKHVEDEYDILV